MITSTAWKNSINAMAAGVGMILRPLGQKSLINIKPINEKVMMPTFNGTSKLMSCHDTTLQISARKMMHRISIRD